MKRGGVVLLLLIATGLLAAEPRIVSLSPATTELLCFLGGREYLVGRSSVCNEPPDVESIPVVGDFALPFLEKVLSVRPTVVVTNDLVQPGIKTALQEEGIRVLNLPCRTMAEYLDAVMTLAEEIGNPEAGQREAVRTKNAMELYARTARDCSILPIIWDSPLLIAGDNTIVQEFCRMAGAKPLPLDGNSGYYTPNDDWLLRANPDVILLLGPSLSVENHRILRELDAVKQGRVIQFPAVDLLERPGPRWTKGVQLLRELLPVEASETAVPAPSLWRFRLWRLFAALVIGGALSVAGGLFQTIFRNPLASPYTLGVSSGAATGAAVPLLLGLGMAFVPWFAFGGALLTLVLVLFFSGLGRRGSESLLLSGVIAGTILSSLLIYLISIADSDELLGVTWWMLGDLQAISPRGGVLLAALSAVSLIFIRCEANDLNALALGDEGAVACGVNVRRLRLLMVIVATLLTALSVSLAGIIGFVGLVVPHITRKIWGANQRRLPLFTFLCGAFFLALCDFISRWLNPVRQTPIGVVTACLGGSIFLILLLRNRRRLQ